MLLAFVLSIAGVGVRQPKKDLFVSEHELEGGGNVPGSHKWRWAVTGGGGRDGRRWQGWAVVAGMRQRVGGNGWWWWEGKKLRGII